MAKTFDGPPTLERSGSERRGGAVSSLSPEGERVGVRGGALFKGKEGRGDFRKDTPHQPLGERSSYFLFFILQKKCHVLKIGSLKASAG